LEALAGLAGAQPDLLAEQAELALEAPPVPPGEAPPEATPSPSRIFRASRRRRAGRQRINPT
jgi:hypothetical protein